MSVLFRTCIGSLAAGLCCLPLANAQQPAATRPGAAQQTLPAQAQISTRRSEFRHPQ